MHVSYWLSREGGGGIQTWLATAHQALSQNSAESVACNYAALMPGAAPGYVQASAANDVHTGSESDSRLRNSWRLRVWLQSRLNQVDVVHIHGVLSVNFPVAALACRRAGVAYVVSPHGSLAPAFLRPRGWKARAYMTVIGRPLLRRAASLVATSNAEADAIRRFDSRLPVRIIPPGIAVDPEVGAGAVARPRNCDLRVAFLGRLAPIKALPTLFAAIAELVKQGMDVRLDVIGDGEKNYRQSLLQEIDRLDLRHAISLHGYLLHQAKRTVLGQADVFVLPSTSEGFGFAAVEALALGVPAVVSDGVGLAPVIAARDCGSVFAVGDSRALSRLLREYRDPEFRARKSDNAYTCTHQEFSLAIMGERLTRLYREAGASA